MSQNTNALTNILYGPSTTACWTLTALAVLLSWSCDPQKRTSGSIDLDALVVLTYPALTTIHLLAQVRGLRFPEVCNEDWIPAAQAAWGVLLFFIIAGGALFVLALAVAPPTGAGGRGGGGISDDNNLFRAVPFAAVLLCCYGTVMYVYVFYSVEIMTGGTACEVQEVEDDGGWVISRPRSEVGFLVNVAVQIAVRVVLNRKECWRACRDFFAGIHRRYVQTIEGRGRRCGEGGSSNARTTLLLRGKTAVGEKGRAALAAAEVQPIDYMMRLENFLSRTMDGSQGQTELMCLLVGLFIALLFYYSASWTSFLDWLLSYKVSWAWNVMARYTHGFGKTHLPRVISLLSKVDPAVGPLIGCAVLAFRVRDVMRAFG